MSQRRTVVHLGTPKSGTTYLQELLWSSRPALVAAGVSYPGEVPEGHFQATLDLKADEFNGWPDPAVPGAWDRLVTAARAFDGTTVISHELLGDLTDEQIGRLAADLSFQPLDLVITARDLARQLPAVWQEDLKNRHSMTFEEFLAVASPETEHSEWYGDAFWQRQDLAALAARWRSGCPGASLTVVTVPPPGTDPAVLWHRFAEVLGIDPAVGSAPATRSNRSLGQVESELLRRLNERLDYSIDWPVYAARVTHHAAGRVLA